MKIMSHVLLMRQFLKFGLVGFSNTAIGYGVYSLLVFLGWHYQAANIAAFVISSLNGFLLNKLWVFAKKDSKTVYQIFRFYIVYCGSFLLTMYLSYLWIDVCNFSVYIAPVLNLLFTVPCNYLLSKFWVYK